MTAPGARGWDGRWVADRLGVRLREGTGLGGLSVGGLVGMALRRNPRRAHLLVSRALGKHVPADPDLVHGAGRLLGLLVAERLAGDRAGRAAEGGRLLAAALAGTGPAAALREFCDRAPAAGPTAEAMVVGYAETATGLGHSVADALGADYLHSTRRAVAGLPAFGGFEESHSHATSHLLLPEDPALLAGPRPLVLVDDELSTGTTVLNTIAAVHAVEPRERYVVAALVDLRSAADRDRMAGAAGDLGARIEVVALAGGELRLPPDALATGRRLAARYDGGARPVPGPAAPAARLPARWPAGVPDGGRHGFRAADRPAFDDAVASLAADLLPELRLPSRARVLVLGTEELMYLPTRLAGALAALVDPAGVEVRVSSTTRSPVVVVDEPGYAVRTALRFGSHDDPADGPGPRFAYNVAPPRGEPALDRVVVVADDAGLRWPAEGARLMDEVGRVCGAATLVTVPGRLPRALPGAAR